MPRRQQNRYREQSEGDKEKGASNSQNSSNSNRPSSPGRSRQKTPHSSQPSPSLPELVPPPPTSSGDTIVANNPFDDPPHRQAYPQPLPPSSYPGQHPSQFGQGPPHQAHHFNMHNKQGMPPHSQHHPFPHQLPPPGSTGSGKIYPPNQPMVFNPSNPNAPPIYPCGICHKEVHDNDQAILCESGCNFWFHRSCTGLTEPAYTMLTQEVYAEWVCDKCLNSKEIPLIKMKP